MSGTNIRPGSADRDEDVAAYTCTSCGFATALCVCSDGPRDPETGHTTSAAQDRKRVHQLVCTVTERHYYDPVELAEKHGITTADEVIEFFELHDGSPYGDSFFPSDANPQVGIELEERWDDE